ncbi:MAG: UDP-N-acetylmuramoyl-tripeptide--D-alanyl-D-alanine ligase [Aquificae bacterium]|nr:UDP-N-acetylmuramoyl-tripeptide--D-alanyl-D-alanine ligase [Aquificota bacterium]
MKLSQIAKITNAKISHLKDDYIKNFVINSKDIESGDFFVPLKGTKLDGHDFIDDAFKRGAYGSFSSKPIEKENVFIVKDTLEALTDIARYKRKNIPKIIGITGTSGKTTTKEIAKFLLDKHFRLSSTQGNFNNHIGLPLSLANAKPDTQLGIYELGTSKIGDIPYLIDILNPDISVLTSVGYAHTEGFGSFEDIVYEKGEIFKGTSIAILPDNLLPYYEADLPSDYVTFGFEPDADIVVSNVKVSVEGTSGKIRYKNNQISLKIPVINKSIFLNLAAVAGIFYALDLDPIENLKPIEEFSGIKGRGKLIKTKDFTIIDDSYNANHLSMYNAVKTLSNLEGKKILVFGDMLELGSLSEELHREIGMLIDREDIDEVYLYGNHVKYTLEAIKNKPAYLYDDKYELSQELKKKKNSIILIKGSRGMKMEEIISQLTD